MDLNLNLPKISPSVDRPVDKSRDDARRNEARQSEETSNQLTQESVTRDLRNSQTKSSVAKSQIQKSENAEHQSAQNQKSFESNHATQAEASKATKPEATTQAEQAAQKPTNASEAQKAGAEDPRQPSLNHEAYHQMMKGADPRMPKAASAATQAPAAALPPQNAKKAAATEKSEQTSKDLSRSKDEASVQAASEESSVETAEAPRELGTTGETPKNAESAPKTNTSVKPEAAEAEPADVKFFSLGDPNTATGHEELHQSQVLNLRAQILFNGRPSYVPGQPSPTASTQSFTIAEMRRGDYKKMTGSEGKSEKSASPALGRSVALGFRRQSRDTAV